VLGAATLVLVCLPTVATVATVANAAGVLVTVSPDSQVSNGRGTIDIDVWIASGATSTCTLYDGERAVREWQPCHASYSFDATTFDDGEYRLAARAKKNDVHDWAASYFTVDSTAPQTSVTSQYPQLLTRSYFYASWTLKRRDSSPVFDVQQRLDSPFTGLGDWETRAHTDRNAMKFTLEPGETVCVRVRATDAAGNVGDWSRELCRTRYVDDRDLDGWRDSAGWKPMAFSNNIEGTALVSKSQGATVTLPDVGVGTLVLFGRKGPYGGSIEIRIGGDVVQRISLKSPEPKAATLFRSDWHASRNGRFVIEVTSEDGRYVHLDALILRR
jgi:hypothetical protein